ncbi:dihydroneopterin triphosphate diphosphatase [Eikenella longinqua]|uniref:Dihydroneopterin triphosphate diphosphatase n=1 Tax=Eikenella longinqua TaxID=1795827 RepID=A0A1A9RVJ3_9NEIS|nr:dihydroneopterin triphosphate diphosphatase [Eikenella longinqua]OAM26146.1 dihydroneopterin triphosphate diphosphatase [Eikenella longinqua]
MSPAYKRPESVLVVLHDGCGQALLLERVSPPGFWQSVTGSLEAGETPFATALREVAEETGIHLAPEALTDWHTQNEYEIYEHWRHRYAPGVTRNTEHVFSAVIPRRPVRTAPAEHRAQRWLPLAEAAQLAFSPSNREALLRLAAETESRLPEKLTASPALSHDTANK